MEFTKLIEERHSVRHFAGKKIDEAILKEIAGVAAKTPSWENNQPWNVYIATEESLQKIAAVWKEKYAAGIKGYADMPAGHRSDYSERSQRNMAAFMEDCEKKTDDKELQYFLKQNEMLFQAPAVAYLTLQKGFTGWAVYDLGAFGMNFMLAAKNLGIDSIPAYEFVKYPDELRKIIGIPENEDIIIGIGLGYPESDYLNDYRADRMETDKFLTIKK